MTKRRQPKVRCNAGVTSSRFTLAGPCRHQIARQDRSCRLTDWFANPPLPMRYIPYYSCAYAAKSIEPARRLRPAEMGEEAHLQRRLDGHGFDPSGTQNQEPYRATGRWVRRL
ncbi:hypothetical protein GQ53DRAFT_746804 [Thozetella sp. PMI_491]|nr:hypothetical protein GQ53DRAFT_746804 [Thozetella sp. PMI_491]